MYIFLFISILQRKLGWRSASLKRTLGGLIKASNKISAFRSLRPTAIVR
jgi:hypothetical protein